MRSPQHNISPWPHHMAVLLVCAAFPLIWVGGLVTTTEAGMAVRDWPTTNGYNIFFLPFSQWFGSGWKLFIEHSHRLLGALTGILTLLLLAAVWLWDGRKWMRWVAVVAVAAVIFQGVLGGFRVIQDERLLAMAHGCTGPLFFALAVVMAAFTSHSWHGRPAHVSHGQDAPATSAVPNRQDGLERPSYVAARKLARLAGLTALLAYVQLVLGAQIRHMPATGSTAWFDAAVLFHLINAALVLGHGVLLAWRSRGMSRWLCVPAWCVAASIAAQVALGAGTWVVNFGWPQWAQSMGFGLDYVVQAQSVTQALITTGHVAMGSLILAWSALVLVRAARLSWQGTVERSGEIPESQVAAGETSSPRALVGTGGELMHARAELVPLEASV